MEKLEKIIKSKNVSLETKAKIILTFMFSITVYGCKKWSVKKADRKKIVIHLKHGVRGDLCGIPWTTRKMIKWVLSRAVEQDIINLGLSGVGADTRAQNITGAGPVLNT